MPNYNFLVQSVSELSREQTDGHGDSIRAPYLLRNPKKVMFEREKVRNSQTFTFITLTFKFDLKHRLVEMSGFQLDPSI